MSLNITVLFMTIRYSTVIGVKFFCLFFAVFAVLLFLLFVSLFCVMSLILEKLNYRKQKQLIKNR